MCNYGKRSITNEYFKLVLLDKKETECLIDNVCLLFDSWKDLVSF